jgi:hypothetical protein
MRRWHWIMALAFLGVYCASRKPVIQLGGFDFEYDGEEYRIESMTPNFLVGYNLLILEKDGASVLKAMDREQNGQIDEVIIGSLSREQADIIYQAGIQAGREKGYIKTKIVAREYRTTDRSYDFVLVTYILAVGDVYNQFTVVDRFSVRKRAVLIDLEANGILDQWKVGEKEIGYYQKLYKEVLDKGLHEKRITKEGGYYIVVL